MKRAALLLPLLALGGAERDPLAGRVAGTPVQCISLDQATSPQIVDAGTILFRRGKTLWRTGPVDACPGLRRTSILIVERFGSQLCRNDRFQAVEPDQRIPAAPCRFDRFTPYLKGRTG